MKRTNSQNRGSVLAFVLLTLVVLLVTGVGFLSLSLHSQLMSIRSAAEIAARSAADAGLTVALLRMNEKLKVLPWDESKLPGTTGQALPNCDATYSFSIIGTIESNYTVSSVGKSGRAVKKVNAVFEEQSQFDLGILVRETIVLKSATLVDGYDSSTGATNLEVEIGSTSGDPESVLLMPGATVNGEISTDVDFDFPPVFPPPLAPSQVGIIIKGTTYTIGPAQSGKYPGISISHMDEIPGVLEIDGGDVILHVTGGVGIGQGCELRIKKGSSLALYLDGDFISGNSSGINNETMVPSGFMLYGTAGESQFFDLKAKNNWHGAVYAPNADTVVRAQSDVYGAFVGTSFEMKNAGRFYYDMDLSDIGESRFRVARWWEE